MEASLLSGRYLLHPVPLSLFDISATSLQIDCDYVKFVARAWGRLTWTALLSQTGRFL